MLLAACYRNALHLVEQRQIHSVAFPAISTGAFGYPAEAAAHIALAAVLDELQHLTVPRHVRFVLFGPREAELHGRILEAFHDRA